MTAREPLSLLAIRAVANAASFSHGHRPAHPAIKEAANILCCLILDDNRNDLWRATEQLCQGVLSSATEARERVGLDALMAGVVKANAGLLERT